MESFSIRLLGQNLRHAQRLALGHYGTPLQSGEKGRENRANRARRGRTRQGGSVSFFLSIPFSANVSLQAKICRYAEEKAAVSSRDSQRETAQQDSKVQWQESFTFASFFVLSFPALSSSPPRPSRARSRLQRRWAAGATCGACPSPAGWRRSCTWPGWTWRTRQRTQARTSCRRLARKCRGTGRGTGSGGWGVCGGERGGGGGRWAREGERSVSLGNYYCLDFFLFLCVSFFKIALSERAEKKDITRHHRKRNKGNN